MIKQIDVLREVSLVDVPAQPFARLTARPVDTETLGESLSPAFLAGVPVSCDVCLQPYPGLPQPLSPAEVNGALIPIDEKAIGKHR